MARKMKDSGIQWVGDIPSHWNMVKTNSFCSTITDYVASGSFASLAENVVYLDEPDYAMLVRTMDVSGKRYLCFQTFEQIAVDLHYSIEYTFRLHKKALEKVEIPESVQ